MATAWTSSAILAFFDGQPEYPPLQGHSPSPQPAALTSSALADMFDAPQGQCAATSYVSPALSPVPFFGTLDALPATSGPVDPAVTECLSTTFSPTVSSSSPSFNPDPFTLATASSSQVSPFTEQAVSPVPPTQAVMSSSLSNDACLSDISAHCDSDRSDSEPLTRGGAVPEKCDEAATYRRRPRVESEAAGQIKLGLGRGKVPSLRSDISRARTRTSAPAELEVGMMFEGKLVTKSELRRIKNRESSARSYYNRKKKVQALEQDLEKAKERATALLKKELALRQENAVLKQRSIALFTGCNLVF